jgi:PAS domain S-box-containing protein
MSAAAFDPGLLPAITDTQRRAALAHSEIGSWYWDFAAGYFSLDARWCSLLGLDPCSGLDHLERWARNIHPDDVGGFRRRLEELAAGAGERFDCEYRVLTTDSRWLWLMQRGHVLEQGRDGKPSRVCGVCLEIDVRKQAEVATQENEARLATALWGARGAFWQWQIAANTVLMSPLWFAMTGYSREQWEGAPDPWFSRIHPEDRERVERQMRQHLSGESPAVDAEYRIRTGNGRWKWMLTRGRAVAWDFEGNATMAIGVSLDIHARKEVELSSARTQEQLLRTVAWSSADWLALFDRKRRCVFLNRPLRGVSPQGAIGLTVEELAPLEDRARVHAVFEHVMATGQPRDFEQVVTNPEERGPRYLEWRVRAVRTESQISGTAVNITEVTERRAQRDTLRTQSFILETMREGVMLVDAASNVIRLANPALDRMFGCEEGELLGRSVLPLFTMPAVQRRHVERSLKGAAAEPGVIQPVEFECARRDGSRFVVSCVITPLRMSDTDHWLAVLNDVTERKRLEREIIEIANREQQRIGGDLHDGLGQELTGIALMLRGVAAQLDKAGLPLKRDVEEVIALVNNAIGSTRSLARGLSPVSAERGGLATALEALAERSAERYGIHVEFRCEGGEAAARLDENAATHVYRIAQEALTNVARHSLASEVTVRLGTAASGDGLQLSIDDNGRGLGQRPADESDGLGLKIMRYRAQMLGGDLVLESSGSGGTSVRCAFPLP